MKVGDRVKCIKKHMSNPHVKDKHGVIIKVWENVFGSTIYSVVYDEDIFGHDCRGKCRYGYGWNSPSSHFILENRNRRIMKNV